MVTNTTYRMMPRHAHLLEEWSRQLFFNTNLIIPHIYVLSPSTGMEFGLEVTPILCRRNVQAARNVKRPSRRCEANGLYTFRPASSLRCILLCNCVGDVKQPSKLSTHTQNAQSEIHTHRKAYTLSHKNSYTPGSQPQPNDDGRQRQVAKTGVTTKELQFKVKIPEIFSGDQI